VDEQSRSKSLTVDHLAESPQYWASFGASNMPALFRQFTDSLRAELAKHRNRPFLEAAMAASVPIAIAEGRC
jgi:hypothetical protein